MITQRLDRSSTGVKLVEAARIQKNVKQMFAAGVFVDPLLVPHDFRYCHERPACSELETVVAEMAEWFYGRYVHLDMFSPSLDNIPFSSAVMRRCFEVSLRSTALADVYEQSGRMELTCDALQRAQSKLTQLLAKIGIERLYKLYFAILAHDVMQPLYLHRKITESDFLQGIYHYPYSERDLDTYLLIGLAVSSFRLKHNDHVRTVQLTRLGTTRYLWLHDTLMTSSYLQKRVSLSRIYQFDNFEAAEPTLDTILPNGTALNREYVQWLKPQAGSHVLEVSCGNGGLTFDAGLYQQVGPNGRLTAVDVSYEALEGAQRKWRQLQCPPNVEMVAASVEQLPFADGVFDASLGSGFLQFYHPKKALEEMRRVVVPGGMVSVFQALQFDIQKPFFRDWFEPLFTLARRHNSDLSGTPLPVRADVVGWFQQVGLVDIEAQTANMMWVFDDPQVVVQHLISEVRSFQNELLRLPWGDLRSVVSELIARGRDVIREYPYHERVMFVPSLMIKGRRPSNGLLS